MTDHRPDIPDLPAFCYWQEGREPSAWNRDGTPYMSIRKRTLFGSKEITRVYMHGFAYPPGHTKHLTKEAAMIRLGKVMGL